MSVSMFSVMIRAIPFFPTRHRIKVALASLGEKLFGLDFSMPDRMYDRGRGDGAMYLASSDEMLEKLFSCVDMDKPHGFLDIGCGKGYVLWRARMWGFSKVGGVEYDEKLLGICRKNLQRLKLANRITPVCCDACGFEGYGDYDVFYFFNPFGEEIMRKVMHRITEQCQGKEVMLLYYRPRYAGAIEEYGCFQCVSEFFDPERGYNARVYRGIIPKKAEQEIDKTDCR